ncbi:MAG: primosomal protein N' [Venatoribacter sp.]
MSFFVIRVALPIPLRRVFDYLPEANYEQSAYQVGQRVEVLFANRKMVGIIVAIDNTTEVALDKLKPISARLDQQPLLSSLDIELSQWLATYYHHSWGEAFEPFLPVALRQGKALAQAEELAWRRLATTAQLKGAKQAALWQCFLTQATWSHAALTQQGFSLSQLRALKEKQLIEEQQALPCPVIPTQLQSALQLNLEQRQALQALIASCQRFQVTLLEGVTGSGKTEVYLQLIEHILQQGKQALILVPEIGLTPQTVKRFQARFAVPVALLHSGLNDTERLQSWRQAKEGVARILIGTRSAVFTPIPELGLIVIDEEHDASFKQQEGLRYNARDFAIVKASKLAIPVLLGSATPSLESLHNALQGKYQHLKLTERAGHAQPPKMRLISLRNQELVAGFTKTTLAAMQAHLDNHKQVLVFLNRRGYAPLLACNNCGWMASCPHCDARLTLHQTPARLHCHHCDYQQALPFQCPSCQSQALIHSGLGTERIADELQQLFPNIAIHRVDRDTVRSKAAFDNLYNEINKGEKGILIGTQMLAKGHHFPNVTLVVILDADAGLFSYDFRGLEHSSQLIEQVSGRAGRAEAPGEVWIQTLYAEHPLLNRLIQHGYPALAQDMLQERQQLNLPPFSHLAMLRCDSPNQAAALQFLQNAQQYALSWLQHHLGQKHSSPISLLGPSPAIMERKANRYRYYLQFYTLQRPTLHQLLHALVDFLEQQPKHNKVRWQLDVDPLDTI